MIEFRFIITSVVLSGTGHYLSPGGGGGAAEEFFFLGGGSLDF